MFFSNNRFLLWRTYRRKTYTQGNKFTDFYSLTTFSVQLTKKYSLFSIFSWRNDEPYLLSKLHFLSHFLPFLLNNFLRRKEQNHTRTSSIYKYFEKLMKGSFVKCWCFRKVEIYKSKLLFSQVNIWCKNYIFFSIISLLSLILFRLSRFLEIRRNLSTNRN